ncbi:MAG: HAD-IIB family hydrolase [Nitrospiraceae bacterium]|nr:HAD-IIB family hydrolase [Nitrospiraceae bacterium]
MARIVILTDLDGSLLDADTYAYNAADEALARIQGIGASLILVSSKTRSEIEPLRFRLNHQHPFVVENGGGLFMPKGYFPFPIEQSVLRGEYQVVEIGSPYAGLRLALKELGQTLNCRLVGFGDLSAEDIARLTGLSVSDALLSKQREYDEPFVMREPGVPWERLCQAAAARNLRCTRGGRFYHLMGASDKGIASRVLLGCYRRLAEQEGQALVTIGIGDSLNDTPMLALVDYPILVQKPDTSYDPDVRMSGLIQAPGVGPVGWNRSVLDVLTRI